MNAGLSLLDSILVLVPAVGFGRGLRKLLRANDASPFEKVVIDAALGFGIVSLITFALAALQLLGHNGPGWYRLFLVIGLLWIPGAWRDVIQVLHNAISRLPSVVSILTGLILLALAVAALVPALAPPSSTDWDSLAYHLAVPKLYLQHGGIYHIGFVSHSNFPFLMEMLYLHLLSAHDPVGAKLINYWVAVLLIASVVVLVRKHFNAKAAPLAALALAGMPIILWESTTAYIDLATALYTVIAVHLLLDYLDEPRMWSLIASAIAAGFAASTKMTGLALVPLLAFWLMIDRLTLQKRRLDWKPALGFAAAALLVCSPWYLKSLIYTGNPVYPFFYSIFGGSGWTRSLADQYSRLQAHFGVRHDFAGFVFLPYDLAFHSELFYDTPGLYIGPILLAAVPLLFLARYRSRKLAGLTLFFGVQLVIWFALTQQSRYLIPVFAIIAAIIAAIAYSEERLRIVRAALYATFIATAAFGLLTLYPAVQNSIPVVFGSESQNDYLSRTLGIYPAQEWMNQHLPRNAKVALYGDTRGFYLNCDYIWADPGHNAAFTRDFSSVNDLIAYLHSQGVTHAMVDFRISFPPRSKAGGVARLIYSAIDEGRLIQVYPDDDYGPAGVYKIR